MMKKNSFALLLLTILFLSACNSQKGKVIFYPDPEAQEQTDYRAYWEIIESQNGPGEAGIPLWVRLYLDRKIREIEAMDAYSGKYVFVGENRGTNFKALQQWANGFAANQDLPRLIAQRVEQRFTSSASLYPDDEYGEYFANTIKKVSDEEYAGAVKDQVFWLKQQRIPPEANAEALPQAEEEDADFAEQEYEFLVLISIDKDILQKKIKEITAGLRSGVMPTREQAAAINRVNNNFFEGF